LRTKGFTHKERMSSVMSSKPNGIQSITKTGNTDDYELISRIGSGRYGEVFEAFNVTNNMRVAIKVLKPVRPDKVMREMQILKSLSNGPNIIPLKDFIINNGVPSLVFPFISNDTLRNLGPDLNAYEVRYYLFALLQAIRYTHSQNIIHRDIKPSNVVIDRRRGHLKLIDWGLADYYYYGKNFSVTVASRHYKPPELLCGYTTYDCSLDMWSFGCIVAALLFKRDPFFQGNDNLHQLMVICSVMGTKCLCDYVRKYKIMKKGFKSILDTDFPRQNWNGFISSGNRPLNDDTVMALDFVDKILVFDHKFRLTADETLSHPFFGVINNKI